MDQARSTITKIFNGEPRSYTRFNLTQNMEGDNSQVEMKLSSDMDEEVGGNGVGDHLNHNSGRNPYVVRKSGRTPRNICFMAATTLLIFIIGYLIGYLVHRKKDLAPCIAPISRDDDDTSSRFVPEETGAAPLMDWGDVKSLLAQKLDVSKFENTFSEFKSTNHRAGSSGDELLGNKILKRFKEYSMTTWTDDHFVKVHDPPVSGTNKVVFKGKEEQPSGFLSYSAIGKATGPVLYAYYGQEQDFKLLQNMKMNLNGRVILVRAGRISFAEKVANAARLNASAVLIYPDPSDYPIGEDTELFGHVHMGSGDPYTPGFPSFNHTQFPPVQSSGLPSIVAQTISARIANSIMRQLGGQTIPAEWGGIINLGNETTDVATVEVNNVLAQKKITNVFGVIKGFVDPDRYVVLGAQRDAWGPGFAKSTVGTSVLLELARSISDMIKHNRFTPRRSIVFASWSGGEYGSVGATEWLEGYVSSLGMKAFSYINLDGVVTGLNGFKAAGSPLMHTLIESTLKEVKSHSNPSMTLYSQFSRADWENTILEPLKQDDASYPFLAFSGIPSISFRFSSNSEYPYFGTPLDTYEKLNTATSSQTARMAMKAAQVAGHITLRLVHDHLLRLDLNKYTSIIRSHVSELSRKVRTVKTMQPQLFSEALTMQWLISAYGSYSRASSNMDSYIGNSDMDDIEICRIINDRIMAVERNLLSPYVSPTESPFRHILVGSGPHTIQALHNHLESLKISDPKADADLFRNQFALATWTIQGCANSLAGDIWSLDNDI
ncbi:transferrin receptor protein 1-like [Diretmus argenteus]